MGPDPNRGRVMRLARGRYSVFASGFRTTAAAVRFGHGDSKRSWDQPNRADNEKRDRMSTPTIHRQAFIESLPMLM